MASGLHFIVVLCLTSGLWTEAKGGCVPSGCFETCPSGWTQFCQRCYKFENTKKQWANAERFCTALGGHLASIHTKDERDFLREIVYKATNSHKSTWVGGTDSKKEGTWLWSDGSKFDFTGWGVGEPNNVGGEDCMEINWNGKDVVNDIPCYLRRPFICARNP